MRTLNINPSIYDLESIKIDISNGNFDPNNLSEYNKETIVYNSIVNGQMKQAREQQERFDIQKQNNNGYDFITVEVP